MKGNKTIHQIVERRDPLTGKKVRQLTSMAGNHHHLYFTSNSFTIDNESIIYISENGISGPNLFKLNLTTGEALQLTDNNDGFLKSYVYYDGNIERGLGKASVSFNPSTNQLLYIQGKNIILLDVISLKEEILYELPPDVMTGFTHLSNDGRYACIPYISAEAFDISGSNPMSSIRDKVAANQIPSKVLVIDTVNKKAKILFSHVGWITHVQFHPHDHNKILFNHEGGEVDQRIWLYDDGEIYKVRNEGIEAHPIWICHEVWMNQTNGIIYHGRKIDNNNQDVLFVGRADSEHYDKITELPFPVHMKDYGHFTVSSNDKKLVTDGIIDSKTIHLCDVNWIEEDLKWEPLCHHGSSFGVQDVHPHPIFSHDGCSVLFTSDAHNHSGNGHVYLVEI